MFYKKNDITNTFRLGFDSMRQSKVQIVIPVYNSAKYLRRCLDSLVGQTYRFWEAIMVDDASSDNSAEIIREYQEKDDRIVFYALEKNQGVSNVRNFALEKLSEKYTAFLDSDDFWEADMLETMVEKAESEKVDVVQCRYFYDYAGDRQELPGGVFDTDTKIDKKNINKIYYKMATGINMNHVCMKLIRTDLIKDIRFDTTFKTAEDLKFCVNLFCKVESYYFINKALYHYCRNEESLTGKGLSSKEKLKANIRISADMKNAIRQLEIDTPLLNFLCIIRPYTIILSKIFRIIKEKMFSKR